MNEIDSKMKNENPKLFRQKQVTKRTLRLNDIVNMQIIPSGRATYKWKSCKAKQSLSKTL